MRVFDESKTRELFYYDLENGKLVPEKLFVKYHPATDEEWELVRDDLRILRQEKKDAYEEYEDIMVYVPFTAEEIKERRIAEIKLRLSQLSEDFVQSWAGAHIADIEARKREFADLHNELRGLLGKEPRVYY